MLRVLRKEKLSRQADQHSTSEIGFTSRKYIKFPHQISYIILETITTGLAIHHSDETVDVIFPSRLIRSKGDHQTYLAVAKVFRVKLAIPKILRRQSLNYDQSQEIASIGCGTQLVQQSLRPIYEKRQGSENRPRALPSTRHTLFVEAVPILPAKCAGGLSSQGYVLRPYRIF